jgi:fluoroquinolone transport system ATP-binding protein
MIQVKNLSYSYKSSKTQAISNLSFTIKSGEIFGFLGPSGAGKTTTQKLLIGLLKGYEGSIKLFDKERTDWGNEIFESVGVTFEFPNLYLKLTARENLELMASYYKNDCSEIDNLLKKVGLYKDADKRVETFSKGMKMRLNFIRSIMHDPKIIFLDEPTSGLDPINARIVKDLILDLKKQGKTIFLTTHDMNVADELCDRVGLISSGEIKVVDEPKKLKQEHGEDLVTIEYDDQILVLPIEEMKSDNFIELIKKKNIKSIHSHEATLEDVFIKIAGVNLDD